MVNPQAKMFSLFSNLVKEIPYDRVSYDEKLLQELKEIDVIKPDKKCVSFLRINRKLETILQNRVKRDVPEAYFQYGQILFYNARFCDAHHYFHQGALKHKDMQCIFQLGIIYYDGLDVPSDPALGCQYMKEVLSHKDDINYRHLVYSAAFNLGRAYYMGHGVEQSNEKALDLWLFAADEGSVFGSVAAQSILGYYFCTRGHLDLEKAFYWHSEACDNGSLASQGVLGVMYFLGIGKPINLEAALICLRSASARGFIYARGMLCYYYYIRRCYSMAANLALHFFVE